MWPILLLRSEYWHQHSDIDVSPTPPVTDYSGIGSAQLWEHDLNFFQAGSNLNMKSSEKYRYLFQFDFKTIFGAVRNQQTWF
jgi:hypothetical protein